MNDINKKPRAPFHFPCFRKIYVRGNHGCGLYTYLLPDWRVIIFYLCSHFYIPPLTIPRYSCSAILDTEYHMFYVIYRYFCFSVTFSLFMHTQHTKQKRCRCIVSTHMISKFFSSYFSKHIKRRLNRLPLLCSDWRIKLFLIISSWQLYLVNVFPSNSSVKICIVCIYFA